MNLQLKSALAAVTLAICTQAGAQITFYEHEGFRGRVFTADTEVSNFQRYGFNDRAASVIVDSGRWEACEDANFAGRCVLLRTGSYDSLSGMGMKDRISSVRPADNIKRYDNEPSAALSSPAYEYRRRPNESTFEANVTSVRAVMGAENKRCWVERQQVNEPSRGSANVGGAILGGILGGVLGHQVGGGRGKDAATVVGALGGGAIGANVGRSSNQTYDRDVQRCETAASGAPAYWDVTYDYRGVEHRLQMSSPPGATIAVNQYGEPRQ